jgi:hypothetical protein
MLAWLVGLSRRTVPAHPRREAVRKESSVEVVRGAYAYDRVPRLQQFRQDHPEIEIATPADLAGPFWKAFHDGGQIAVQHDLGNFLDALDAWVAAR